MQFFYFRSGALSTDGISQYEPQLCDKLICILLDQLNYGRINMLKDHSGMH